MSLDYSRFVLKPRDYGCSTGTAAIRHSQFRGRCTCTGSAIKARLTLASAEYYSHELVTSWPPHANGRLRAIVVDLRDVFERQRHFRRWAEADPPFLRIDFSELVGLANRHCYNTPHYSLAGSKIERVSVLNLGLRCVRFVVRRSQRALLQH